MLNKIQTTMNKIFELETNEATDYENYWIHCVPSHRNVILKHLLPSWIWNYKSSTVSSTAVGSASFPSLNADAPFITGPTKACYRSSSKIQNKTANIQNEYIWPKSDSWAPSIYKQFQMALVITRNGSNKKRNEVEPLFPFLSYIFFRL